MATSRRLIKDGKSYIVEIPNFADEIAEDELTEDDIFLVGNLEWSLRMETYNENGEEYLDMSVKCSPNVNERWPTAKVNVTLALSLINEDPDEWYTFKTTREFIPGEWDCWEFIEMSTLLAPENGFLTDGVLRVQVEIRVDVITDKKGIRRFNFYDPFEGCLEWKIKHEERPLYARKELITYHFPGLAEQTANENEEIIIPMCSSDLTLFEVVFQLMHGVKMYANGFFPNRPYCVAQRSEFDSATVIRHIEACEPGFLLLSPAGNCESTPRNFKKVLRTQKSDQELQEWVTSYKDFLSSELKKAVVREFFSRAVDFRSSDCYRKVNRSISNNKDI